MEEKMRILKMIEEGKINAQEALDLLDSLGESGEEAKVGTATGHGASSLRGRKLRIIVTEQGKQNPKVNVRIPLRLVQWAERFIPAEAKEEMEEKGIHLDDILREIQNASDELLEGGSLVDVTNEITGEHVSVSIE